MELCMQNREHGIMILESIEHGPLIWPTVEENGMIRTKKYAELSAAEKIQADCDMKATNIILQGLPANIYSLVNHHRVAKDLWERVQLLMQGTSLTKQERECKLYHAFDKFTHIKRESLHTYYLRFTQLINDMNIYNMKMEQFQVNTKFLNTLPHEWSKFVTDVKLVKDLHTSSYDQLHAYLRQHELHANEIRLMRERNRDPLAFVANQQMTPPHFNTYQSSYNNLQLQQQFSPSQQGSIQPRQHYSSHYPSQPQLNHSSTSQSYTFQDDLIACLNKAITFLTAVASSSCQGEGRMARQCIQPKRQRNDAWYKEKAMLAEAQEARQILDKEQLTFLADPGIPAGQSAQTVHMLTKTQSFYDNVHIQALGYQNPFYLKKAQQMKPTLSDGIVISEKHVTVPVIDNEETLILEEESRSKMSEKAKDPEVIAKNISHKAIDYEILNRLTDDFGKRFTRQQKLSAEQAFWLRISNPTIESSLPPVRVEVPSELPKEDPPKDPPEVLMADDRTVAELLRAPTEGYEDAIVFPEIAANNFELKHVIAKVSMSSSTPAISSDVAELKDMVRALLLDKKNQSSAPAQSSTHAPVKAVEPNCVTCGGTHSYQNCLATCGNVYLDNIQEYVSQTAAINYNQGNTGFRPQMVANQIRPPSFPPHQNNQNNFNRGNNFNQNRGSNFNQSNFNQGANEQIEKFYEIFKDMSFEISFTDALILMPKFASTLKALIGNKEKLSEMARTPMNKHCSAVILNKLPRKLGDPDKFLIPCEFPGMDECLALADLGASINLMPLSVWKGLSLPELTPTCMTLELADRLFSKPIGIAKDVSVKVGVFHFPADFVVVDFKPDPRVPFILRRCFLKNGRALIDVNKGKLTLRIGNEAITYNLDQTSRYSANYNQMTANKIDVICEEYSQEVLGFSDTTTSGNPTPHDDPIVSTTSPTLTPFGNSDFLLFEVDAFLGLEDDPNLPEFNPFYYDPEGDILLLEDILNSEPLPPLPNHEQYLPSFKKELKGDNKLPVIIAKELGDEEKSARIKVLKSHKRAIAWKLSDIQGINPKFCTHKILIEEDYKPAEQHQRRVNPKIHDVIKKEVEKLLDAGLIYPISDSPWVSLVHCVPKKGGFTIVENEENELIPTRLVTEWRVCIDYQKLNEATHKDHFPLPFIDQMLERLAGNKYYCFLDGLSGCEDTNLSLNWEKSHFMVKEGIVLGHKISKNGIKVDKAKVDVIAKLPHPTTVKAPILIAPNWDLPFELMCNASDIAIGAVLGQRHEKHFKPIHYASKMMNDAESN
nr:reverse transcriptase domain-containing protein [Tanacetum cinerariifolium]